ncbi:hypothetical protein SADUNF_Sadunf02G0063600 [Salix dunnii]|uniref:Uncharacterized protein n=1 Tax=Salix dunnii TaxID=1413687 RepID=A0A835N6F6_9ROSI|nr:hypothetical protein SADUNF_Sadunf02G0063600 [Salix dunnii]
MESSIPPDSILITQISCSHESWRNGLTAHNNRSVGGSSYSSTRVSDNEIYLTSYYSIDNKQFFPLFKNCGRVLASLKSSKLISGEYCSISKLAFQGVILGPIRLRRKDSGNVWAQSP